MTGGSISLISGSSKLKSSGDIQIYTGSSSEGSGIIEAQVRILAK